MLKALQIAVRQVGDEVVIPFFHKAARLPKADGSTLTEADIAAQAALEPALRAILDVPLLGEEMTREEQQASWDDGAEGVWVVDPIDGTANFANGMPYFSLAVALVRHGKPVLGVVYAPALGEMFSAELGKGAWRNGERLPLNPQVPVLSDALAGVDFKRLPAGFGEVLAREHPFYSQRNLGSAALEICYVASGSLDIYLHGGLMLWDFAAASLILDEAGGQAGRLELPAESDFWSGDVFRKSVVAGKTPSLFQTWHAWLAAKR